MPFSGACRGSLWGFSSSRAFSGQVSFFQKGPKKQGARPSPRGAATTGAESTLGPKGFPHLLHTKVPRGGGAERVDKPQNHRPVVGNGKMGAPLAQGDGRPKGAPKVLASHATHRCPRSESPPRGWPDDGLTFGDGTKKVWCRGDDKTTNPRAATNPPRAMRARRWPLA